MAIKTYKPTSPALREKTTVVFDHLTKKRPEKSLTAPIKRTGGRNFAGRVTVRWMGGGHKRIYRLIDFKRDKRDVPAKVSAIEYDPNRSANIALLNYADGEKRYIICPDALKVGDTVVAGETAEIRPGNALPLRMIPVGAFVHNIEMRPEKAPSLSEAPEASLSSWPRKAAARRWKLPSNEVRQVALECYATVGQIGNLDYENITIGKAGRSRWFGRLPKVRGVAMNPVDHPHGGGEGKSKGGHPESPWGTPAKGYKTRRRKDSGKYIIQRRK